MSQNSLVIPDGTGASVLAAINNAINSLVTQNGGAGAPGSAYPYMLWADTTTGYLKQRNSGNTAWNVLCKLDQDALAALQSQLYTAFTSAGTAPTYTLTTVPALTAYAAGQRFRVKAHAAGTTGSNTLNVNGLGAKNLMQYDSTGAKVSGVVTSGQLFDAEYDGTDFVILDPLPPTSSTSKIQPITATVASNALTLGLNPTSLDFRAASLTNGVPNTRNVTSALSLVVPSGATLGTVAATQARLVVLAIDNNGTVELAVVNLAGGNNLDETTLISTTAISAAASSSSVIYSASARTNVPFRVVGFVDITEATAGTWATAPSTIQGAGGNATAAMQSLGYGQTWQSVIGSRAIGTTYYNTTGKPILVSISGYNAGASSVCVITVNGVAVTMQQAQSASVISSGTTIVPAGGSYSVGGTNFATLALWAELR